MSCRKHPQTLNPAGTLTLDLTAPKLERNDSTILSHPACGTLLLHLKLTDRPTSASPRCPIVLAILQVEVGDSVRVCDFLLQRPSHIPHAPSQSADRGSGAFMLSGLLSSVLQLGHPS